MSAENRGQLDLFPTKKDSLHPETERELERHMVLQSVMQMGAVTRFVNAFADALAQAIPKIIDRAIDKADRSVLEVLERRFANKGTDRTDD